MSALSASLTIAGGPRRWVRATAGLLFLQVSLIAVLQVMLVLEGSAPILPMVIVGVLALGIAVALAIRPSRVLCAAAAVVMALDLLGSAPHEIANVASGALAKQVFGIASLLTIVAALTASVVAFISHRADRVDRADRADQRV